ncbi:MAG: proline--tRNA ligase [Planctomycetes bacterium]|nr:proline--tRNA ligase [Planctomycetota bacterium]
MRWDEILITTRRDTPTEAETVSNKLMLKTAMIRRLSSGVYIYLPFGMRTLLKAMNIVREEMNRIGAQEVMLPVLQPLELLKETGRDKTLGSILFTTKDKSNKIYALGPTHEEIVTHLARVEINSYRQLPISLYQIQVKFRDEPRPRGGVLRSREFIMKDSYSFNKDWECLSGSYKKHYDAYVRIFKRSGVNVHIVEADTGAMGGSESHEFMCRSDAGEDSMVLCGKCSYSANVEKAECLQPTHQPASRTQILRKPEEVNTPGKHSVQEVAGFLGLKGEDVVKTIVVRGSKKYYACLIRGDHEINLLKLQRALKESSIELATPDEVENVTGSVFGFTGPVGLTEKNLDIICDNSIENISNFVAGGNRKDTHLINVNLYRDFKPTRIADVRLIKEGDPCPRCLAPVSVTPCIEVGHIFKLGTKYSEAMELNFLTEKGENKPVVMGCYGIGVNRIIASAIETHNDEKGIIWPKELAPFNVYLASINPSDKNIKKISQTLHDNFEMSGLSVLWDDRDTSAGVKFADADLLGIPVRVIAGKKLLENGKVDIKKRVDGQEVQVEWEKAVDQCRNIYNSLPF